MSNIETEHPDHSHHGEEQHTPSREVLCRQIGERLRNARQHRDMSLDEAVHSLKLRKVYVEALENGDWESLPGEVYALGFLRQYAGFLELDLEEDIRLIKSDEYELTRPETFPDPPIAPKKSWIIVALLALLVLFVIFNIFNSSEPPAPTTDIETPVTTGIAPENMPEQLPPDAIPEEAAGDSRIQTETNSESPAETTSPTPAVMHTYRFEAVDDDVWLQLYTTGESPQMIREVLLHQGESLTVAHPDPVLSLTCGNPPALAIYFDGKLVVAAGRLGSERGKVIRDYPLNFADN